MGAKKKHVRAVLKYSGYVFLREAGSESAGCRAVYIVYLDPCGWIPTWVVNQVAPDNGMVIKEMIAGWPKVQPLLDQRKAKDYQPLFDAPQVYDAQENGGDEKEEQKDDDRVFGGWAGASRDEIFEAANAVKEAVEKQAEADGKDAFKIFECVDGQKQVVAGTNYKLRIRVADDAVIELLVFKSLPPNISFELKSVEY